MTTREARAHERRAGAGINRRILALAVPALGALVAEPLFLLADSAIIGHLGVDQLAGVGLAATVIQTAVGLMVFLAYSTTAAVARRIGAGDRATALAMGRDGMWLGVGLGVVLAVAGWLTAGPVVRALGAEGAVAGFAADFLRNSMPGLVAMLLVLAATGVLRGLQDTRTPLVVAVGGFGLNIVLDLALVYGAGWSVTGAAIGTSLAQWSMAVVYLVILGRAFAAERLSLRPSPAGIVAASRVGSWLMLRTLSLRVAILTTVLVATAQGPVNLAAHQLTMTMFNALAMVLDALAIAGQALIGRELGGGDLPLVRGLTRRMILWGTGFGVVTGVLLAVAAPWLGFLFTGDDAVRGAFAVAVLVLAVGQPICGLVFVLDGILIGAGDARYLALTGLVNLATYLPLLAWVHLGGAEGTAALAWLWAAFAIGYLASRALTLSLRARTGAWMVTGAP
ncbi:MATE family efflux transporter [Tersicoccus solisilvae]|uniref:MATE family efflux transporter n=1 Tax=Tersicoccus solisilvae TaxID=1882339 RepID=A0ABQ1NKM5_9MICC|nr:MATE family efflux transporter [Tersicoccus solisilvae]GGC79665.1 MATE family efflux transporter [Tersicoccus solisilvae]